MNKNFWDIIKEQGFNCADCPYTPIRAEWETIPIIKAIRHAEKVTGATYYRPQSEEH